MTLNIGMVTVDSSDPRPLATWWSERLGAPIVEENEGWFIMIGSTPMMAIQHVEDPTPGKNRVHLDLVTEDLDATRDDSSRPAPPSSGRGETSRSEGSHWQIRRATSSASPNIDPSVGMRSDLLVTLC